MFRLPWIWIIGVLFLALLALLGTLFGVVLLLSANTPSAGANERASAVVQAASALQEHLRGPYANVYDGLTDPFMRVVTGFWIASCGHNGQLCPEAESGQVQCVMFVTAAFWLAGDPLPRVGNAADFWSLYQGLSGWQEIPSTAFAASQRGRPEPGDLMVWQGGTFGHIAVVLAVASPSDGQDGHVTVAQANEAGNRWPPLGPGQPNPSPGNVLTLPLHPDRSVTMDGLPSFTGYQVLGYLRQVSTTGQESVPAHLPTASARPGGVQASPYVALAMQDAREAGINTTIFVRQIQQESGFNPSAVSQAGAIGIAQFMPATAAGLGLDPHDPVASLAAAAHLMQHSVQQYGGDYARALAAYNAGTGVVQAAQSRCGVRWLSCLPAETQHYVQVILQVG